MFISLLRPDLGLQAGLSPNYVNLIGFGWVSFYCLGSVSQYVKELSGPKLHTVYMGESKTNVK